MRSNQTAELWRFTVRFLCAVAAFAALTFVCFRSGLTFSPTAFAFMALIAVLSLMSSFVLSVAFSILAVGLLNYFFTEPLFTFRVDYPQDIAGLIAFLVTSLIVTSLVSRSRKLADLAIASHKETLALKDQLRLIIDTTPALVWSALPDGSNDFVNRGWVEFTGLSLEDTKGSGWSSAIHPDDLPAHWDRWRMSVATGKPFEDRVRFRRADGQHRWLLIRAAPLHDERGNIVRWYGTCIDIDKFDSGRRKDETGRKRASDSSSTPYPNCCGPLCPTAPMISSIEAGLNIQAFRYMTRRTQVGRQRSIPMI